MLLFLPYVLSENGVVAVGSMNIFLKEKCVIDLAEEAFYNKQQCNDFNFKFFLSKRILMKTFTKVY